MFTVKITQKLYKNIYAAYIIQVVIYILLSLFIIILVAMLGARQGEHYIQSSADVSGLGFLFWFTILGLYISDTKKFKIENSFQISIILFYLSSYFLMPVGARIFESALIIVLFSGINLSKNRRILFFISFGVYFLWQFPNVLNQLSPFVT